MEEWRERLRAIIDERGWGTSWKQLCREAGLGETFVRDVLDYGRDPSVGKLIKLANKLGVSVSEILDGNAADGLKIPINGTLDGDSWLPTNLPLSLDFRLTGETVSLEVRSELPGYHKGDVIIGIKAQPAMIPRLIGHECIVMTRDGARHVRYLLRGSIKNRYNLRSPSPSQKDIENIQIDWVAPVTWVRRSASK